MNAASQTKATGFVKKSAGQDAPVQVTGAWRLWFEHPSHSQTQFGDNPFEPDNTNPNHSFEIHPVASIGAGANAIDVLDSFVPIQYVQKGVDFQGYSAEVAFPYFDSVTIEARASDTGVAIRSPQLKYNYVEFAVELTQKAQQVEDGWIALGRVVGNDGEEQLPGNLRLIFVGGSPGADVVSKSRKLQPAIRCTFSESLA